MTTIRNKIGTRLLTAKRLLSLIIVSSSIVNVSSFAAIQQTIQAPSIQKQLAKLEASSKG